MPSEADPLLPNNQPAPEISGYGFSSQSQQYPNEEVDTSLPGEKANAGSEDQDVESISPLKNIAVIFTLVVAIGFFLTLTLNDGFDGKPDKEPLPIRRPPTSLTERAEAILEDTPLIGCDPFLFVHSSLSRMSCF